MLFLTGFQVPGTPGRTLMESGRFMLDDYDWAMKMRYTQLDFSSHTGCKDLFAFVEKVNPKKVFCVHGDNTPPFAEELRNKGFDAVAPTQDNRIFEL
jgi:putative mRNA 3-end processing factor